MTAAAVVDADTELADATLADAALGAENDAQDATLADEVLADAALHDGASEELDERAADLANADLVDARSAEAAESSAQDRAVEDESRGASPEVIDMLEEPLLAAPVATLPPRASQAATNQRNPAGSVAREATAQKAADGTWKLETSGVLTVRNGGRAQTERWRRSVPLALRTASAPSMALPEAVTVDGKRCGARDLLARLGRLGGERGRAICELVGRGFDTIELGRGTAVRAVCRKSLSASATCSCLEDAVEAELTPALLAESGLTAHEWRVRQFLAYADEIGMLIGMRLKAFVNFALARGINEQARALSSSCPADSDVPPASAPMGQDLEILGSLESLPRDCAEATAELVRRFGIEEDEARRYTLARAYGFRYVLQSDEVAWLRAQPDGAAAAHALDPRVEADACRVARIALAPVLTDGDLERRLRTLSEAQLGELAECIPISGPATREAREPLLVRECALLRGEPLLVPWNHSIGLALLRRNLNMPQPYSCPPLVFEALATPAVPEPAC